MYCGYVVELHGLRKHSNADRLQCVTVFGNNVIVDLSYYENQKAVFFPVGGQLDQTFAAQSQLLRNEPGGYMDPDKRNIKAIRIRGEKSEGLLLPIESLSPYVDVGTLHVGDEITTLGGTEICKKYIPYVPRKNVRKSGTGNNSKQEKEKKDASTFPLFKQHKDTKVLAFCQNAFKPGDKCIISLKMHGTSARTSCSLKVTPKKQRLYHKLFHIKPNQIDKEWKTVSGTRRVILTDFENNRGYYGEHTFRRPYHDFFSSRLEKGETVYYEIVGYINETTPIMGSANTSKLKDKEIKKLYGDQMEFSYGCEKGKNDIYVYRMTLTNEDGYVVEYPDWLMRLRCEQMGVKAVPLFETFTYTTWEDLIQRVEKYYDGPDPIDGNHIREGVVVRIENRSTFTAYKHKNFVFKLVSGLISESIDSEDMSEDMLSEL